MEINCQKIDQLEQIIPYFAGTVRLDSLVKFGAAAEKSLAEYSMNRPPLVDVLWNMQYSLQLQEIFFFSIVGDGGSNNCMQDLQEFISQLENIENEHYLVRVSSDVIDVATSVLAANKSKKKVVDWIWYVRLIYMFY